MLIVEIQDYTTGSTKTSQYSKNAISLGKAEDNDIVLARPNISRRHARISNKDGKVYVEDGNSTNGTYVNGVRIPGPQLLSRKDEIRLGDFVIRAYFKAATVDDDTVLTAEELEEAAAKGAAAASAVRGDRDKPASGGGDAKKGAAAAGGGKKPGAAAVPAPPSGAGSRRAEAAPAAKPARGADAKGKPPRHDDEEPEEEAEEQEAEPERKEPARRAPSPASPPPRVVSRPTPAPTQDDLSDRFEEEIPEEEEEDEPLPPIAASVAAPPPSKAGGGKSAGWQQTIGQPPLFPDTAVGEEVPDSLPPAEEVDALPAELEVSAEAVEAAIEAAEDSHTPAEPAEVMPVLPQEPEFDNEGATEAYQRPIGGGAAEREKPKKAATPLPPLQPAPAVHAEAVPAKAEGKKGEDEPVFDRDEMFMQTVKNFLVDAGPLLDDGSVSEIMINGPDHVYVERGGKIELTSIKFRNEDQVLSLVRNVAQYVGRRVNEESPYMDARLPDGSRVAIMIRPCCRVGPSISIRKFSRKRLGVEDLIKFGSLSPDAAKFVDVVVKLKKNLLVSGGTGSGKTSLLNIVSGLIPSDERIIVIEDASELQLQQEHVLPFEAKPPDREGHGEVTIRDLVKASLRFRPDRIIVGECRGGEALDLLQAMNTGHSGSMATIHASSPTQTLSRLETLALFAGLNMPILAVRSQVATSIEVVLQTARLRDGSRKVTHISEVLELTEAGNYQTSDIFRFEQTAVDAKGKVIGSLRPTGKLPTFLDSLKAYGLELPADFFNPAAAAAPAPAPPAGKRR